MVPGRGTHAWLLHGATPMYGEAESQGKGKEGEGRVLHNQRFVYVILLNPLNNFRRQVLGEDYGTCPRSYMETGPNADLSADSTPSPSGCGLFPLG